MLASSGIYQIRNTANGKVYVGSAKIFKRRWSCHRGTLRRNKHHSRKLQNAWNKYGADAFVFEPLITCAPSMLLWYEQQFLDQVQPQYNISPTAGNSLGVPCSPEKRAKISAANKGRRHPEEFKAFVSAFHRARVRSQEELQRASAQAHIMCRLPQTRESASRRARERNVDPAFIAEMVAAKKGKPVLHSDEAKQNRLNAIREYNRTRPQTEALRKSLSDGQKLAPHIERFVYEGASKTVLEWSELYKLDRHVLRKRLNAGWTMADALTRPVCAKPRRR